jgi:hypothetical protein
MATTYRYQTLIEPDAIRLIHLYPSPDLDSPLYCNLLSTSLTRCHNDLIDKYTALSYVWGDPTRSCLITVDGEAMYITASLFSALRYVRDRYRKRQVWADAICLYVGGYRRKYHRNLRSRPLFSEGVRFASRIKTSHFIHLRVGFPIIRSTYP